MAQPLILGLSLLIKSLAVCDRIVLIISRVSSRNLIIPLSAGFIRSLPLYFRRLNPRKSNPSSMCVIFVFSIESSRSRSLRKLVMIGSTVCSRLSFVEAVQMKSSAYLTNWMLFPLLEQAFTAFSSPSSTRFAIVSDARPPYAKERIMRSKPLSLFGSSFFINLLRIMSETYFKSESHASRA